MILYVLSNEVDNTIVAVYDSETLATKMTPYIEERYKVKLKLSRTKLNPEISVIGNTEIL